MMEQLRIAAIALPITLGALVSMPASRTAEPAAASPGGSIELPTPIDSADMSVEEAIAARRSVRRFSDQPLSDDIVSRLLWSAQGITEPAGSLRAAPSAGATYPLELYLVDRRGVFRYQPAEHRLQKIAADDRRNALARAALGQDMISQAPISLVFAAVPERTTGRYGKQRGERYVHMEVGHAAQNIHLQAVALGLGSVPVGAFHDNRVRQALELPAQHQPLYIIPVGKPR
jgi:SagB-type dehydrogenase family enzyme